MFKIETEDTRTYSTTSLWCLYYCQPILSQCSIFYVPWKRQKIKGFLKFSGGTKMEHRLKNGLYRFTYCFNCLLSTVLLFFWSTVRELRYLALVEHYFNFAAVTKLPFLFVTGLQVFFSRCATISSTRKHSKVPQKSLFQETSHWIYILKFGGNMLTFKSLMSTKRSHILNKPVAESCRFV